MLRATKCGGTEGWGALWGHPTVGDTEGCGPHAKVKLHGWMGLGGALWGDTPWSTRMVGAGQGDTPGAHVGGRVGTHTGVSPLRTEWRRGRHSRVTLHWGWVWIWGAQ